LPYGKVKVSSLQNPTFIRTKKGKVLCYCDKPESFMEQLRDIVLKDPAAFYPPLKSRELEEAAHALYVEERKEWAEVNIDSGSETKRTLANAIMRGYDCNNEYIALRASEDYPGFREVDHRVFFYDLPCPTQKGMNIEDKYRNTLGRNAPRYNTFTQLAFLHELNGEEVNEEVLLIFNYLGKIDLYMMVKDINPDILPRRTMAIGQKPTFSLSMIDEGECIRVKIHFDPEIDFLKIEDVINGAGISGLRNSTQFKGIETLMNIADYKDEGEKPMVFEYLGQEVEMYRNDNEVEDDDDEDIEDDEDNDEDIEGSGDDEDEDGSEEED